MADRQALLAEQEAEARRRQEDDIESFEIRPPSSEAGSRRGVGRRITGEEWRDGALVPSAPRKRRPTPPHPRTKTIRSLRQSWRRPDRARARRRTATAGRQRRWVTNRAMPKPPQRRRRGKMKARSRPVYCRKSGAGRRLEPTRAGQVPGKTPKPSHSRPSARPKGAPKITRSRKSSSAARSSWVRWSRRNAATRARPHHLSLAGWLPLRADAQHVPGGGGSRKITTPPTASG
jgi:hypothetical protein